MKPVTLTFSFGGTDTTKDANIDLGIIEGSFAKSLNVKIPAFSGTLTGTLTIYDLLGEQVYQKASLAKSTTTYDDTKTVPLCRGAKTNITLTAAAGSAGDVIVTLYTVD